MANDSARARSRWRRLIIGLGVTALALAGAAAAIWHYLQPERKSVALVTGAAPPSALQLHCKEGIGEPRIEQLGERVFAALGHDLANTIVLVTDLGNVVIDPGSSPTRAAAVRRALAEHAPAPTRAIIYTHSHIDHVGGASAWLDDGAEIWATEAFADHFVKQYTLFRDLEMRRAARQFGAHVAHDSLPCSALGRRLDFESDVGMGALMPTRTFSGRTEVEIGGLKLELVEAHGETHDQLFAFVPSLGLLMPGDNYYRAFPNLYTIRGTSPRPVTAWIASIDAMRRRAPEILIPSHTVPLRGRAEIAAALTRYRDGIQWVRDQVVRRANRGATAGQIAETIGLPAHLAEDPALAPLYGQLDWSARAIYSNDIGWFNGRPEELYPLPERVRARRTLELMGGAEKVLAKAEAAHKRGEAKWALALLAQLRDADAVDLEPGGAWATAMARAIETIAEDVGNSNGRGYLLETAFELRNGPQAPVGKIPGDQLLDAIPISAFFAIMATRLIPELGIDTHEAVVFSFTDTGETHIVTIRRGVAEIAAGEPLPGTPEPLARVTTTTAVWRRLALGVMTPVDAVADGALSVAGSRTGFYTFTKRFRRGM